MVFSSRFFYKYQVEPFDMGSEEYDLIPACGEIREASKRGGNSRQSFREISRIQTQFCLALQNSSLDL
jgi:hypothetical protein